MNSNFFLRTRTKKPSPKALPGSYSDFLQIPDTERDGVRTGDGRQAPRLGSGRGTRPRAPLVTQGSVRRSWLKPVRHSPPPRRPRRWGKAAPSPGPPLTPAPPPRPRGAAHRPASGTTAGARSPLRARRASATAPPAGAPGRPLPHQPGTGAPRQTFSREASIAGGVPGARRLPTGHFRLSPGRLHAGSADEAAAGGAGNALT